jgi:hypothetical protein
MNRNTAIALAIACAAAGTAYADDITVESHPFVSSMSRAQVIDEMRQFRKSGVNPWADDYNQLAVSRSPMTRAEVMAEFRGSRNMIAAFSGEDSGSSYLNRLAAVKARPAATELALVE